MNALRILLLVCWSIGIVSAHDHGASAVKFIENKGQFDARVLYKCDLPGGALFAERNCLTYNFYDAQKVADLHGHPHDTDSHSDTHQSVALPPNNEAMIPMHAFRVYPLGATTSAISGTHAREEAYNYFTGNDPSKWASNAKAYGEITYKDVYYKTDLRFFENEGGLKYEFILAPGAEVGNIKMRYEGVRSIYLDNDELVIETTVNVVREQAPVIYQLIDGRMTRIRGKFKLDGETLSFELNEAYNHRHPLVLDPQLIFSTYSGSTADNWGNTACFDDLGNMYSGGTVFGPGYPTTVGAYQIGFNGIIDVGIQKFNPMGTTLIYATYIGGNRADVPFSLVVNRNNELVIMGATGSTNFPTSSDAFDRVFNGGTAVNAVSGITFSIGSDIFVSRLNVSGSALLASTYIGGSQNDGVQTTISDLTRNYGDELRGDVITDSLNNIYVVSCTGSINFPEDMGSLYSGGKDAVVFKFNSAMNDLVWCRFLGGESEDAGYSIQIDANLEVYVAGGTESSFFPVTPGVIRPGFQGVVDGFVTHLSIDGAIINSTYLGTTSFDQAYFVQLDDEGNVVVFGQTQGQYPVTAGVYSNVNSGQFIHGITKNLSATVFSTVIGNGGFRRNISPTAFLVNECGNIFLSGWGGQNNANYGGSNTAGMQVTPDAFRTATDGNDFYIMALSKGATSLLYATYFGAFAPNNGDPQDHVDGGTSRFDKRGIIYEAVCAGCGGFSTFPTTPDAYSRVNRNSNCNTGSFKFDLSSLDAEFELDQTVTCDEQYIDLINNSLGGKTFLWNFGDGQTSSVRDPGTHQYATSGQYTVTLTVTDITTCIGVDIEDTVVVIDALPRIEVSVHDTSVCKLDSVQLFATCNPTYKYKWSPSDSLDNDTLCTPYSYTDTTQTYTLVVTDTNGCKATRTLLVNVGEVFQGISYTNDSDCSGKLKALFENDSFNARYDWYFGDGNSELNTDHLVEHEYSEPGTYSVVVKAYSFGCTATDTLDIVMEEVFFPNLLTPNLDGKNDVYEIKGMSDKWSFEVFNRWGESIYLNSDYKNTWGGENLSDGVYYYLITSPNKTRCKGWVQIIR